MRVSMIIVLFVACFASVPSARAQSPTTASAPAETLLAPPSAILEGLESNDPERRVEAFRAWHAWRGDLPTEERPAANRFLARDQYFDALADTIIYDFEDHRVRLSACKLMKRIGGQRVFPIFLWSVSDDEEAWDMEMGGLFANLLYQPAYIKWYFGQYGDPTVIEHLPKYRWYDEVSRINERWNAAPVESPEKNWEPIKVEDFVADLRDINPARRRLALRALATCGKTEARLTHERLAPLLGDSDASVRLVAARVLCVVSVPEMRGPLKRVVEDENESNELRAACLMAVAHCGKARNWTAEWILENLPDWPEEMDDAAAKALTELCPPRNEAWGPYRDFLERRQQDATQPRVRQVLAAALRDIP